MLRLLIYDSTLRLLPCLTRRFDQRVTSFIILITVFHSVIESIVTVTPTGTEFVWEHRHGHRFVRFSFSKEACRCLVNSQMRSTVAPSPKGPLLAGYTLHTATSIVSLQPWRRDALLHGRCPECELKLRTGRSVSTHLSGS